MESQQQSNDSQQVESQLQPSTENQGPKCILHTDRKVEGEKTLLFKGKDSAHWVNVKEAAGIRSSKQNFQMSKYFKVVQLLPSEPGPESGYHTKCYSSFTAVPKSVSEKPIQRTSKHLRSQNEASETFGTGVFPKECIFCHHVRKRKQGKYEVLGSCETVQASETIQNAAIKSKDDKLMAKISGIDLIAKEARYHHSCKRAYLLSAERLICQPKNGNDNHTSFGAICSYIEKSVMIDSRPELLTSVYARYVNYCEDSHEDPYSTAQYLMQKLQQTFKTKIKIQSPLGKKTGVIVFPSSMSHDAVRVAYDYTTSDECLLTKAALLLRKLTKFVNKKEFGDDMRLDDVVMGEACPPELVDRFFRILYGGPDLDTHSSKVKRVALSSSQDALYIIHNGHVKPSKHISLGVALKSMTGSKKVVTILNRLGHCVNYNYIEELETAIGSAIERKGGVCPDGTVRMMPMGLAFDNYDELSNTLSGADTLHDTMGILYQNECHPEIAITTTSVSIERNSDSKKLKSRKRKLDIEEVPLEPYRKKPKMGKFEYDKTDIISSTTPNVNKMGEALDFVWMASHSMNIENVPMWVGFNSKFCKDTLPKQVVRYMQNMRNPITSLDVIRETLNITQRCALECGQEYGVVTYDLNAAKPALQIQATESPTYDNIFIMLGSFHIEMAFFKALGKVIAESGGPYILTEADIVSSGSLNGVLQGKNFNRCKRVHPILSLAFQTLHFNSFFDKYEHTSEIHDILKKFNQDCESTDALKLLESNLLIDCQSQYMEYSDLTRHGKHGPTAQFWLMYVDYIHYFLRLERAIRTNDVQGFAQSLTPLIALFFMTNHVNYARWLTKFQLDIYNIETTHPGLLPILEQGAFTVRRTNHQFSRIPVDLTLEQTVNADAASRLTGISAMTNNYAARLRWMLTKSSRAAFVNKLQEMTGITKMEDVTSELRTSRLKRNKDDLDKLIRQIQYTCNPFGDESTKRDELYNISTGKATSNSVKKYLLEIQAEGHKRHKQFSEECIKDPERFQQVIKKEKILTFRNECISNKRAKDRKVADLRGTRDLMGRLAVLASQKKLDLEMIFSYPLTPVPLTLFAGDGTMAKTDKSALFHHLESKVESSIPKLVDACVVDGNFMLHLLPSNKAPTYGALARMILVQVTSLSKYRIDILFDSYAEPSIKDCERDRRGTQTVDYFITGSEQRCPRNLGEALRSISFKKSLPLFLIEEWTHSQYMDLIGERHVYVGLQEDCYHFFVTSGEIRRETVEALSSNHYEADTRICLHAKSIDNISTSANNIVIRAADTDIMIIMLYHIHKFKSRVWMDVGTASKNNRRYISISDIANVLGIQICRALPAFHAFTGCDYTSAFVRKGKIRPFTFLEKNTDFQATFALLASQEPTDQSYYVLDNYICKMYGSKTDQVSLNNYRYSVVEKSYGPKVNSKNPLDKLKGVDGCCIPPCHSEVIPHINRAAFVARMWGNATSNHINQEPPSTSGWKLQDNQYEIIMFDGPQIPDNMIQNDDELNNSDESDDCLEEPSDSELSSSDDDVY